MKIRIEISSGNMSYVLDKETDMDVKPQAIIEDIERTLSSHEVHEYDKACCFCDNFDVPSYYEPCYSCMTEGMTGVGKWSKFTRKTY